MYIGILSSEGGERVFVQTSLCAPISSLKNEIENKLKVSKDKQALYFRGKHLEDDLTLHDYKIQCNETVHLVVKRPEDIVSKKNQNNNKIEKDISEVKSAIREEIEEIEGESKYYKVGDAIDCIDSAFGAWFEAVILKILNINEKIIYKVRWDLPDTKDDNPFNVEESFIRPRAWKTLNFSELKKGQKVMVNYNLEDSKETGYWYDFTIINIKNSKNMYGTIHIGGGANDIENCSVSSKIEVYEIEKPVLLSKRNDDLIASRVLKEPRKVAVKCTTCKDNPKKKCTECSCSVCGKKSDPHLTILCDECDIAYHIGCLKPPLTAVPTEDEWYCPDCKVNTNEIVKVGEKVVSRIKNKTNRDWGRGFACVARQKECTIVPKNHKGAIPGVEVGTSWKFRVQVSESGVHRPPVSGIHGREQDCAYSIVLSGGYEDDVDNGDTFIYTGSGGRDLSGNKRTANQSSDQKLTKSNLAIALNCYAKIDKVNGAEASDWKKGIPIRVVRNYKLHKHSKYAPEEGNRYDGLYKVVKYWPERGQSGFKVWRFFFRRDDPSPAPWTEKGKKRIADLGLKMIFPPGYIEAYKENGKFEKSESDNDSSEEQAPSAKKRKLDFKLDKKLEILINADKLNKNIWNYCKESLCDGQNAFIERVNTEFMCVVCQDLVCKPTTITCGHNICTRCLKRSFEAGSYACPTCRQELDKNYEIKVNKQLSAVLIAMFPAKKHVL